MRWSVILNTCNRARFLALVLRAWGRQRGQEFSIVIADDGSEDGTAELVRALAPELPFAVTHVWHPRKGHRRAEILNKAVHRAESEALLFTDADSLPGSGLLASHASAFDGRRLLCGGYVRLAPEFTATVTEATAAAGDYESQLTPERLRTLRWQHYKNAFYIALRKKGRPHNMGLNMALPRSAYLEINGYDNEFRGWGRADGDLRERLRAIGVRPFSLWDKAIVFHLHHPPDATKAAKSNEAYSERHQIPVRCASGFHEVEPEVVFSTGELKKTLCGIAGIVGPTGSAVDHDALFAMALSLRHRGPDGGGVHLPAPHVGLAHRRLAVIDPAGGAQPMANNDRRIWITFNGEIFNFRELRAEMSERGRLFWSKSDTEVLLALYELEGVRGLSRLRGQYAFAIWDGRTEPGKLVAARDPLGIIPFYWSHSPEDGLFLFASEPRGILVHPRAPREVDPGGIHLYLRYRFIPSPRTAWKSMQKLRPGEILELEDGKLRLQRPWGFVRTEVEVDDDEASAAAALGQALEHAVDRQKVADVPVGAFLSGGIDSSTIATLLARHTDGPLTTFTVGFREDGYDERRFAELVADHIGSYQVTEEMDGRAAMDVMPKILDHMDEPFGDPSLVPTWLLCSLTARHGKVAMSGDGGDELFGGYGRTYRALGILAWPSWLRPLHRALRRIRREGQDPGKWVGDDPRVDHEFVRLLVDVSPREAQALYGPRLEPELRAGGGEGGGDGDPVLAAVRRHASLPPFSRLLAAELETKLADYHLVKVDRAAMAHGLEVRVPFLDQDLVKLAFRWTPRVRLSGGRSKGLLRDAMAATLPADVLSREKQGFGPPLRTWLRGELGATVRAELLGGAAVSEGWLRHAEVARLTDPRRRNPAGSRIWRLWVLERWLRRGGNGEG